MKKLNALFTVLLVSSLLLGCTKGETSKKISKEKLTIEQIQKINYTDSFALEPSEYIVYFWQSGCKYCQEIEPDVLKFAREKETPIYIVDMQEEENKSAWYDWENHHKKYDKIIGKIVNDEEHYNEGIHVEDFINDTKVLWNIVKNDKGDIIATHNTPYGNETPNTSGEIEITGTPTMIKMKDNAFSHMQLEWKKQEHY